VPNRDCPGKTGTVGQLEPGSESYKVKSWGPRNIAMFVSSGVNFSNLVPAVTSQMVLSRDILEKYSERLSHLCNLQ